MTQKPALKICLSREKRDFYRSLSARFPVKELPEPKPAGLNTHFSLN